MIDGRLSETVPSRTHWIATQGGLNRWQQRTACSSASAIPARASTTSLSAPGSPRRFSTNTSRIKDRCFKRPSIDSACSSATSCTSSPAIDRQMMLYALLSRSQSRSCRHRSSNPYVVFASRGSSVSACGPRVLHRCCWVRWVPRSSQYWGRRADLGAFRAN